MESKEIRQKLHQHIDTLDDASLGDVYNILKEDEAEPWRYSPEDLELINKRHSSYLEGKGKNLSEEDFFKKVKEE